MDSLRLLTFNSALPVLKTGKFRFSLTSFARERLRAIPELLRKVKPDVIALQEVFDPEDQNFILSSLSATHAYVFQPPRRSFMGCGLLFISNRPIVCGEFVQFGDLKRVIRERGCALISIRFGKRTLRLLNTHISAPTAWSSHTAQVKFILDAVVPSHKPDILMGDFNCSEHISPETYRLITHRYADSFLTSPRMEQTSCITWDANNTLNSRRDSRRHASQQIDHIFMARDRDGIRCTRSHVTFNQPCVCVPGGQIVTLSDHYGLMSEFRQE